MPEHMHLLIYPHPKGAHTPMPISILLHAFKKYVGYEGKKQLRKLAGAKRPLWSPALTQWLQKEKPFWQTRGYDFNIDRHDTLIEKLHYCHKNPFTRGLVADPADWPWSSYRYYEFGDTSLLRMDWDKSWPIQW